MLYCQVKVSANTRQLLLAKDKLNKLKAFDSNYFIGKSHFEEDGSQIYLVFQPLNKYFKLITDTLAILSWKSKELSTENIDPLITSLSLLINYAGKKVKVKFNGSILKQ